MKDLRSEESKVESERTYKRWQKELADAEKARAKATKDAWKRGVPWLPIESCPFKGFEYEAILVTDGKTVAIAKPHKRFGTPMRWKKEPEMAMTDHGIALVSGEIDEIKAPKWWFEWELTDEQGSMTYAGGEETGKEEVPFIATHWLPLPPATLK